MKDTENFSIQDHIFKTWNSLDDRITDFDSIFTYFKNQNAIMRKARSAPAHIMLFEDRKTKKDKKIFMFGSNNYLGLGNEEEIKQEMIEAIILYGIGCGGPPLLNGYTEPHERLENKLARIKSCEDALVYPSGYSANLGWVTALLKDDDYLVYDSRSHASLFDAMKMGSFNAVPFSHNNTESLRRKLKKIRNRHPLTNIIVCVEGVYSMDGDIAPVPEIKKICREYSALLAIDDAHGTGILGNCGYGVLEHFNMEGGADLVMGTFSKTFSVAGGFVAGTRKLINFLRFFSRSYMFSASLPTPIVVSVLAGIRFMEKHPELIKQLHSNTEYMGSRLKQMGFNIEYETAIMPLFLPPWAEVKKVVCSLFDEGVFINGIEYPAVSRKSQRLRISMMATFTEQELDYVVSKFKIIGEKFKLLSHSKNT